MASSTIVVSDLHLGSAVSQASKFSNFIRTKLLKPSIDRVIFNGDMFDSLDFRRLTKPQWHAFYEIRQLSREKQVIWIAGNHDGNPNVLSSLLNIPIYTSYSLSTNNDNILILHGHTFDKFIKEHPVITYAADTFYWMLQKLDRSYSMARWVKQYSKVFVRCAERIKNGAIEFAQRHNFNVVCCGHSHLPETDIKRGYFNSGSWVDKPCTYLEITHECTVLKLFSD